MKCHVDKFAHQSITTEDWKEFLYSYMRRNHGEAVISALDKVEWKKWFHAPGMPPVKCDFDRTLAQRADELAVK